MYENKIERQRKGQKKIWKMTPKEREKEGKSGNGVNLSYKEIKEN